MCFWLIILRVLRYTVNDRIKQFLREMKNLQSRIVYSDVNNTICNVYLPYLTHWHWINMTLKWEYIASWSDPDNEWYVVRTFSVYWWNFKSIVSRNTCLVMTERDSVGLLYRLSSVSWAHKARIFFALSILCTE